jgi:hypothetical protein
MGGAVNAVSDAVGGAVDAVGDVGKSIDQTVRDVVPGGWTTAALLAGGYAYDPTMGGFLGPSGDVVPGSQVADLGTATGADLSAAYDMSNVGAAGAGGPIAAAGAGAGLLGGAGAGAAAAGLGQYALPGAILGSSLLGANAANNAAQIQADAARQANELAYKMYGEQKALQEPYRAAGVTAQNRLMDVLGLSGNTGAADYGIANKNFTPSDLTTDPSYQFRLNEGLKALDRQAAARGGLISGGALKAAQDFGQQSASQEYQNAFNRYQTNRSNLLQPLGNLITTGQNAAANTGAAAGNYSTTASNNLTSGAAASAAGTVGATNALTSGLNQYLNYSSNQDLANAFRQSAYAK